MKPRIRVVKPAASSSGLNEPAYEEITLAEQAYRQLRRDIISGALPAGQALRLEGLKERYGISYSPLREALNRLHSEQLVLSHTSRGFRVAPFSEDEMWDAVETRIIIDCEALRRSLARGDGAWEARLVAAFHALKHAREQRHDGPLDAADAMQADDVLEMRHNAFHSGLIEACGSRSLLSLSAQFYAQTERYRRPSLRDPRYANLQRDVPTEHSQILEAALARDAQLACALLARHYRETGRVIQQLLALDAPEAKRR